MKHLKPLFWLAILTIAISCADERKRENRILAQIEHAWNVSDTNLDSAITLCNSLRNPVYRSSEYTRMKFDLLEIRIRYKRDFPATPDSIRTVTTYMEKHGTPRDKMRAYYYLGGIYDDLNDSPKAVEYALKSLSYLHDVQYCDTSIAQMDYSMLVNIYTRQRNLQEAIDMGLASIRLTEKKGTTRSWYIMDVVSSYNWVGDTINRRKYLKKAYERLLEEKDFKKNLDIAAEMMLLFAKDKEFGKVDTLAVILRNIPGHELSYDYNHAMGVVYEENGQIDSAIKYYTKNLDKTPPRLKQASLSHLFLIHRARGDYEKATEYAQQYQNGMRALNEADQQEWTRNAKGMYDYQKNKEEEEAIIKQNARLKFWGAVSIGLLLTIIAALIAWHLWRKKKLLERAIGKEEKLSELRKLVQNKNELIQAKEQALSETEERIRKIGEELRQKQALAEELIRQTAISQARTSMEDVTALLENAARSGRALNEEEWKLLITTVNNHYPDLRGKMASRMPRLKEEMVHTCYLMKMGMSNQQIETLTQCAHQTAWNRIKRIRAVMGEDIPS